MGRTSLDHYFSVVKGTTLPLYCTASTIPAAVSPDASDSDLWNAHKETLSDLADRVVRTPPEIRSRSPTSPPSPPYDPHNPTLMDLKVELGRRMMKGCCLCERRCSVNRTEGERGVCGVLDARISSEFIHMGEEPELVPSHTIFFAGCNLSCIFCQNWDISQDPFGGARFEVKDVVRLMERRHALNTNWVGGDPTPNLPFILEVLGKSSVDRAQVWNSNMYLTEESMALLDGVMDLYLTDLKYGNNACGRELSGVEHYFDVVTRNHLLIRGQDTIIRHLVLPGHLECCTMPILKWIKENRSDAVVNVMAQYHPDHKSHRHPVIGRRLRGEEYRESVGLARELGLQLTN